MSGKLTKRPKRARNARVAPPATTDSHEQARARLFHAMFIPGAVYSRALAKVLGEEDRDNAAAYARDVFVRMAPRDAVEEMLIAQLLFAHVRAMRLTSLSGQQTVVETVRVANEYADRASNTYRRLMLALAEYRRPPRTGDTFAVVRQANIAGQQVVQNHEIPTTIATNEQGWTTDHAGGSSAPAIPAALPVDAGGIGFPAFNGPARATVDAVHGAKDPGRQGQVVPDRDEAR